MGKDLMMVTWENEKKKHVEIGPKTATFQSGPLDLMTAIEYENETFDLDMGLIPMNFVTEYG
jgi:hypothetical protein